jgi:predicted HicB family RNase H-like nuclease
MDTADGITRIRMVERQRERTLNVRIDENEGRMLRALSEHQGVSISDVIRQYIRRAFAEAFPTKKTKK